MKLEFVDIIDLVTGFDLCDQKQANLAWQYFRNNEVFCAVMAPVCGSYEPMATQNCEGKVRPLVRFCGHVAELQLEKSLHFIQEQPLGSWLYSVQPWPQILRHAAVVQQSYDRCAAGLKVTFGKYKGYYIKKPSTMTASAEELVIPFRNCKCHHRPDEHLSGEGHAKELSGRGPRPNA